MKIERTLNAWKGIVVKVVTDEDVEDMEWAAVLEDHGDEYLIVKTKDKKLYKYGCFANLKNAEYTLKNLVKKPEMYGNIDSHKTSNEIYFLVDRNLYDFRCFRVKKCYSKDAAQRQFDRFIELLNNIHDSSDDIYDSSSHIGEVIRFLTENGIDTEENIEKVNTAHWDSKINGINGIAGKKDISGSQKIYFESMGDVYVVDEDDLETVDADNEDEWGFSGQYLNVEPDKKLNANKHLYALVFGEESLIEEDDDDDYGHGYDDENDCWQDWMNNDEVELSDDVTILFDKTFVDEKSGEALYLVIDKSDRKPVAQYIDAAAVMKILGKE